MGERLSFTSLVLVSKIKPELKKNYFEWDIVKTLKSKASHKNVPYRRLNDGTYEITYKLSLDGSRPDIYPGSDYKNEVIDNISKKIKINSSELIISNKFVDNPYFVLSKDLANDLVGCYVRAQKGNYLIKSADPIFLNHELINLVNSPIYQEVMPECNLNLGSLTNFLFNNKELSKQVSDAIISSYK